MLLCPGGYFFFRARYRRALDGESLFDLGVCAEFLKIAPAIRIAAALVGHYREHTLAPEVKLLELSEYGTWICAPPAWTRDHDVVVFLYVVQVRLELWAGIVSLLLLRHLGALNIVSRIFLYSLDLEKVGSHRVAYVFSHIDFREQPPFFKITDTHSAATWLEDPRAPKMEKPKIVSERIRISLEEESV